MQLHDPVRSAPALEPHGERQHRIIMRFHALSACIGLLAEKQVCVVLITSLVNQPEHVAGLVLDVVIRLFRR